MFGRYEKHNNSTNEHKFYEIAPTADYSKVAVAWGRIDTKGSGQLISRSEASDRINKKKRDGYDFVSSQVESVVIHSMANHVAASSVLANTSSVESETTRMQQTAKAAIEKARAERREAAKLEEFSISDWITK